MNHATAITFVSAAQAASPNADALTTVTNLFLSLIAIVGGGYLFLYMLRSDDPFGPGPDAALDRRAVLNRRVTPAPLRGEVSDQYRDADEFCQAAHDLRERTTNDAQKLKSTRPPAIAQPDDEAAIIRVYDGTQLPGMFIADGTNPWIEVH